MTNRRALADTAKPATPIAADELDELARLAGTLRPDWRGDIWLYYQTRSDLIARLHRLARWAREQEAARLIE
jgi:hypothetical protein